MNKPFRHRPPQRWTKLAFEINEDLADQAAAFIADITGKGVEQSINLDEKTLTPVSVTGYLDSDDKTNGLEEKIRAFLQQLCGIAPTIVLDEIIEEDWGADWKKHFKPVHIGNKIIVKPTWEPCPSGEGQIVLEIDPGLAFGTGLHASTRLALQLIEVCFSGSQTPQSVLDVGTGTGILGIAAAKFGAERVEGIDNDVDAVVCANENIKQNGVERAMSASENAVETLRHRFDLVVANITSDVLIRLARPLIDRMAPKGKLVLAGILAGEQAAAIEQTFRGFGLTILASPVDGEWQAFLFSF